MFLFQIECLSQVESAINYSGRARIFAFCAIEESFTRSCIIQLEDKKLCNMCRFYLIFCDNFSFSLFFLLHVILLQILVTSMVYIVKWSS